MRQYGHTRSSMPRSRRRLLAAAAMVMMAGGIVGGTTLANADTNDGVTAAVVQAYADILHRAPDPGGQAFWEDQIRSGALSVDGMRQQIFDSDEAKINRGELIDCNANPAACGGGQGQ